jgi:hypothetical protein
LVQFIMAEAKTGQRNEEQLIAHAMARFQAQGSDLARVAGQTRPAAGSDDAAIREEGASRP